MSKTPPVWGWYRYRAVVPAQSFQGGKERYGEGGGVYGGVGEGGDGETASEHQHKEQQQGRNHLPFECLPSPLLFEFPLPDIRRYSIEHHCLCTHAITNSFTI